MPLKGGSRQNMISFLYRLPFWANFARLPIDCLPLIVILAYLFGGVLAALAAVPIEVKSTSGLHIEGQLKLYAYPVNTNGPPSSVYNFILDKEGCRWSVLFTNFPDGEARRAIKYSTDCNDVFKSMFWTKTSMDKAVKESLAKNPSLADRMKAQKTEVVTTSSGSFPTELAPYEASPWIAFLLSDHLQAESSNTIPSIFFKLVWPATSIPCLATQGSTKFNPPLPERVIFWQPGYAMHNVAGAGVQRVRLPKPYDQGYVGLVHEVTSWDYLNGVPLSFVQTYSHVIPLRSNSGVELVTSLIIVGNAKCSKMDDGVPLKPPPTNALVVDLRTNISRSPIFYDGAKYGLLKPTDVNLSNTVKEIRLEMKAPDRQSNPYSFVIIILLVLAPVIIFLKTRKSEMDPEINS